MCALWPLTAGSGYSQAVNAKFPAAKVTVTEVNRSGQSNQSGNYTFPDMPPGQCAVTAELSGFEFTGLGPESE
jgi:Carboxypeptidase regulatory-like domain